MKPLLTAQRSGTGRGTSAYVRNNYISDGTTISPNNKYSIKGDQVLTSKQRISFFFERTREQDLYGPTGAPGLPEPLSGNPGYNRSDVYRISYDYTISPTLLNRFYAGGNNWEQNHGVVRHLQRRAAGPGTSHHTDGLEEQGNLHTELSRLQRRLSADQFFQQRVHQLGRGRAQRFGQHRGGIP